jgi:hypothetical protein
LNVADGHHSASHDNNSAGYERIANFHLRQLTTWPRSWIACRRATAPCSTTRA